ncbi:helix-turn-helix transcriptional regulator [Nocardiopsis sp. CT-R113]|uniref:Helix-turn-helix transcriptional regulator n=1 Tax=Nocardiopsis codii TaxID=3065942 RepID=A0ABU7KA01_9ACTN|nr:helix-turn-helix transcriptional regulator [Nocardiopsis sp. CT-R113]MEE2039071.1 helix-turn-helix transcriptional regulator [Nocardiopsis sp. CT-R113]
MTAPQNTPAGRGAEGRDRLARALRDARADAAVSGVRAGQDAGMSQSKISKIERGLLLPSVDDVAALCRVYGIAGGRRTELVSLAEGLRQEASSRVIMARGVSEFQRRVTRIEADASLVRSFEPALVLGALQTREYTRRIFDDPRDKVSTEEAEASVEARQERHRALRDGTTGYRLIMHEGALRWHVGSPSTMVDQIEQIAAIATRVGSTTVGIIPWTTPVHVFPGHAFDIYDEDAVVVATETATATLTGAADIATYTELFTELEKLACFGAEAVVHLERIAGEYRALSGR